MTLLCAWLRRLFPPARVDDWQWWEMAGILLFFSALAYVLGSVSSLQ